MTLPKLHLSIIPEMEGAPGMHGSSSGNAPLSLDDRVVVIMVYVYEVRQERKKKS